MPTNATQYLVYCVTCRELTHLLKCADPDFFEGALRFLEEDPRTFGSGYLKERIWHCITCYPLDTTRIQRLEAAAIHYLFRPMSREF